MTELETVFGVVTKIGVDKILDEVVVISGVEVSPSVTVIVQVNPNRDSSAVVEPISSATIAGQLQSYFKTMVEEMVEL